VVPLADSYHFVIRLPAYVSLAALTSLVLLGVLYMSQRRDLHRLRAWMEREPGHPAADLRASEALLDRAEADLEALLESGDEAAVVEPRNGPWWAPRGPPRGQLLVARRLPPLA
jgi:hypothetical protein